MKGIDISQHNGNIDFNKVKPNIDFAILRLGWIGNHNNHTMDTRFEHYYSECRRLGIPVGVYIYNYATSVEAAKSGANWTVKKLQGKKLDLPVYIDMEDKSGAGLGKTINTNIVVAFNTIIEKAGLRAGVYANLDWFNNKLNKTEIKKKYTTWIAHYGVSKDKYKGQYDILQYTSTGRINGIGGNVDLNEMYKDLIKGKEKTPEKPKPTQNTSNTSQVKYYKKCSSKYTSIVEALNSIGINSSYTYRKKIAAKNGIKNYTGSAKQNIEMLNKLKQGKLIKV